MRVSFLLFLYIFFFWHRSISSRTFTSHSFLISSFFSFILNTSLYDVAHAKRVFVSYEKIWNFEYECVVNPFSLHLLLVSLDFLVVSNALLGTKSVVQNRFVFVRRRTREDAYQTILFTTHLFSPIHQRTILCISSILSTLEASKRKHLIFVRRRTREDRFQWWTSLLPFITYTHISPLSLSLLTKLKNSQTLRKKWRT